MSDLFPRMRSRKVTPGANSVRGVTGTDDFAYRGVHICRHFVILT